MKILSVLVFVLWVCALIGATSAAFFSFYW